MDAVGAPLTTRQHVLEFVDPVEGCTGYLVYDRIECRLAAGGCRMWPGLTVDTLSALAERMTLKQRVLGTNVDGAKCGVDFDPQAPGSRAVLGRFLEFLRHELLTRFSMGCDMGTRFEQLEELATAMGIGSVKVAVKKAQGFSDEEFARRQSLLDAKVGAYTVSQRRAGHAVAAATVAAARHAGYKVKGLHVGLQGFGNLGRAAAYSLANWGASVTAVGDEHGCMVDPHGFDVARMLQADRSRPVVDLLGQPLRLPPSVLCELPVDVLVLAAAEDALTPEQAAVLPAPVVVVAANCGITPEVERILTDRGVVVVPDFIGGIGGSASMETLFGPASTPSPKEVLDLLEGLIDELVTDVLGAARTRGLPPSQVALDIAAAAPVHPDGPPYGSSPYLPSGRRPRGNRVAKAGRPAKKRGKIR
ncbi:MAG TPA: Glu/Leu/Phe/Val dehydrogenase dimerization domain-containing protein [Actinophytocola sp.]|uniref:Glu/Leu/Phe/Val dehydrogenase dimerization domain-containing protein n=1 Tax=Actinophytocola sp. TaxID=1872138 RepID=UPI002DDDA71A|nr:Glu/Leu/Phe/Val dehydrogenase dimerization domain-containing protein [Actinophytocola sp.]HEV2778119.1 Glu/Leu/Phe/Val dehydrogenase dimerization domain-containing protein [Actinophytocola sp.]